MKKMIKKRVTIALAIAVLLAGFYLDKKRGLGIYAPCQQQVEGPLVKKHEPLTIHNATGAKVKAAFYNKRFKRSGSVIDVDREKIDVQRRCQAPYLAVARAPKKLGERIDEEGVPYTKITRTREVKIASKGHDLVVTPTGNSCR